MTVREWFANPKRFIWSVGLSAVVLIGFSALHPIGPPSAWVDTWQTEHVAEWLAWIGVLALVLAIFQIIETASAATASVNAVKEALGRIERLEISVQIRAATDALRMTIKFFIDEDYPEAAAHCDATLELLSPVLAHLKLLSPADQAAVREIVNQVGSASTAASDAQIEPIAPQPANNIIATLRTQKNELTRLSAALRTNV